jgi:hypothetical protein
MNKLPILLSGLLASTATAIAFSAPSHEAIAQAAMKLLNGSPAGAKVQAILAGESPENAAIWLDQVRESFQFPTPAQDADATQFRHAMPGNQSWHRQLPLSLWQEQELLARPKETTTTGRRSGPEKRCE